MWRLIFGYCWRRSRSEGNDDEVPSIFLFATGAVTEAATEVDPAVAPEDMLDVPPASAAADSVFDGVDDIDKDDGDADDDEAAASAAGFVFFFFSISFKCRRHNFRQ